MGKGSTKAPPAPNPDELIKAQTIANQRALRDAARFNQVAEVTPFGSRQFVGDIGTPDRTAVTSLSPSGQRQLEARNALAEALLGLAQSRASQIPAAPLDFAGLPARPGVGDFGGERDRLEQAQFQRARNLIDGVFADNAERLRGQLTAAGIPAEFQPSRAEVRDLNRRRDQALSNAALSSVAAGGAEQSRLFGLADAARRQAMTEALLGRSLPFQELAGFAGAFPVQTPAFQPLAQSGPLSINPLPAFQMDFQRGQANAQRAANANLAGLQALMQVLGTPTQGAFDRILS